MSVNQAWQGRRFKTPAYKQYEMAIFYLLPKLKIPSGDLQIIYKFGINKLMDYDNPIKSFQDILQKKYGFDDRRIMKAVIYKIPVKRGEEFIEFYIQPYESA